MMLGMPWSSRLIVAWRVVPPPPAALTLAELAALALGAFRTMAMIPTATMIETVASTRANDGPVGLLPNPIRPGGYLPSFDDAAVPTRRGSLPSPSRTPHP